ncbi:hypothetical protein [Afipia carboxidovorans]|uniref:hypothetical protein n=1 Tax=Afipia carboxidovorans TaxID=40137 RepID=UPI003089504C|nr:hypothetical protein CRBSH125_05560 [Afipia carboxidovorans]
MNTEAKFTDDEKAAEAERELRMRKQVYPRRVADGRMTQADADRKIAIMAEIAEDYKSKGRLL